MAGFALAACGSNPYDRLPGVQPAALGQQQPANTGPATGAGQVQLVASTVEGLGAVLTDQDGHTLYRFSKDKSKPPQATCDNACAETWPPLVSDTPALVAGVEAQLVSWVTRNDGRKQVTVGGWPVYRYAKDTGSGVALGQNVSADWAAITPTGARATSDGSQVSGGQNSSQGTTIGIAVEESVALFRTFDFLDASGNLMIIFSDGQDSQAIVEGRLVRHHLATGPGHRPDLRQRPLGEADRPGHALRRRDAADDRRLAGLHVLEGHGARPSQRPWRRQHLVRHGTQRVPGGPEQDPGTRRRPRRAGRGNHRRVLNPPPQTPVRWMLPSTSPPYSPDRSSSGPRVQARGPRPKTTNNPRTPVRWMLPSTSPPSFAGPANLRAPCRPARGSQYDVHPGNAVDGLFVLILRPWRPGGALSTAKDSPSTR